MKKNNDKKKKTSNPSNNQKQEEILNALKELENARKELQRVQELQQRAKEKVEKATISLKEEETFTEELKKKVNYNSKDYWDHRYENDLAALTDKTKETVSSIPTIKEEKNNDVDPATNIYEWYIKFEGFSHLLRRDIQTYFPDSELEELRVYIPGCGNSSLAEDLYQVGMRKIIASDFSASVINTMKKRTKEMGFSGIEYKETDLFEVKNEENESYDIIIDKGTLDAIASSKEDNTKKQEENIRKYFQEMWKILKKEGILVIISTMTPALLETLITSYLMYYSGREKQLFYASNWSHGHIQEKLRAEGGGTIYYYSLMKIHSLQDRKEIMKESIDQLLLEARKLRELEEFQEIEQIENAKFNQQYERKSDTAMEKIFVSKNMNLILQIVEDESELFAGGTLLISYIWKPNGLSSSFQWDENDTLRLVLSQHHHHHHHHHHQLDGEKNHDPYFDYLYYGKDEVPYDQFEYITVPSDPFSSGKIKIHLPEYGGIYHISYLRETITDATSSNSTPEQKKRSILQKQYSQLAQTKSISLKFLLFTNNPARPSTSLQSSSLSKAKERIGKFRKLSPQLVNAVPSSVQTNLPYQITIENMQNIRKLMISIKFLKLTSLNANLYSINRILCWLYSTDDSGGYELFLEFDQIISEKSEGKEEEAVEDGYAKTVKTEFIKIQFRSTASLSSDPFSVPIAPYRQFDLLKAHGELLTGDARSNIANTIMLRIPYQPSESLLSRDNEDAILSSLSKETRDEILQNKSTGSSNSVVNPISAIIRCKFCDQLIVENQIIEKIHILPTGMFDQSMHDFVCCENIENCFAISSDQVRILPQQLYLHPIYLSLHRDSLLPTKNSCDFSCKENYSLNDLFHPITSTMLTKSSLSITPSSSEQKNNDQWKLLLPVLSMDSCFVSCSRCKSFLGEATLQSEEITQQNEDNDQDNEEYLSFRLSDLQAIKLFYHAIKFESVASSNGTPSFVNPHYSIEQVLLRLCIYIFEKYSQSILCFYSTETVSTLQASQSHQTLQESILNMEVITVRIISKSAQFYEEEWNENHSMNARREITSLQNGIKITFDRLKCRDLPIQQLSIRIPLLYEEFKELYGFLRRKTESAEFLFLSYR